MNKINIISQIALKFSVVFLILVFTGCISVKPSSTKSGKHLFETFYVGEEGLQYFIKPLVFSNIKTGESLFVDFTFRYKNEIRDSVTVNFTIQSNEVIRNVDRISFNSGENIVMSEKNVLLFNERVKELYNSRFTTKIQLKSVITLFNEGYFDINLQKNNSEQIFTGSKKTTENIISLKKNVFTLFLK